MKPIYAELASLQDRLNRRLESLDGISRDDPRYSAALHLVLEATSDMLDVEEQIPEWERRRAQKETAVTLLAFSSAIGVLCVLAGGWWRFLLILVLILSLLVLAARFLGFAVTPVGQGQYLFGATVLAGTALIAALTVYGLVPVALGLAGIVAGGALGLSLLGLIDGIQAVREIWRVDG